MQTRPRASLGRILHDLGSTVLDVAASPGELDAEVTGVYIYDPLDELLVPPGGIVLAVGVHGAEEICALLASAREAAGIVVKLPVDVDEQVRSKVLETGVAVLGLTRAASWAQIVTLLRSLLAEGDLAEPGDGPQGDLFSLANAVCALLDAPVTIEDRSARVLAYSGRQDEADPGRVETVLGRQVPERYQRMLDERGFFKQLYQSRDPVYMELDGDSINRAAIAVRSGDEILGSIWAAVHEPLTAQRQRAFADAAKIVALQLLRERAGADTRRRLRADLLSTVLAGGADAAEAAGRLGIATQRLCVLAAQLTDLPETDPARVEGDRQRFCDALALHVAAIHPKAAAALVGSIAYAVLPLNPGGPPGEPPGAEEEVRAVRVAQSFLARVGPRHAANVGVGRLAASLSQVSRSRA
ncbi:PucR family transcriptional regulator, partial [Nonomuraea sp. NPDC005983]|uniref:PucR family transcriptional regulator n=1 Tax=Nonomuraea sp. NPDC005983 TaxID=3155595 RepID=UPI0033BA82A0